MGDFFAKRLRVATIAAAITAMLAALYIDWWKGFAGESDEIFGYSYAILFGCIILGFGAVQFMARMPEPRMPGTDGPPRSILRTVGAPFRDKEFRGLINFMFMWNFVAQLAVPFFTVYMLVRLEMPLSLVVALGVLSPAGERALPARLGNIRRSFRQQGNPFPVFLALLPGHSRLDLHDAAG